MKMYQYACFLGSTKLDVMGHVVPLKVHLYRLFFFTRTVPGHVYVPDGIAHQNCTYTSLPTATASKEPLKSLKYVP